MIQIATNFANDVFDHEKGADTDERLGPTRAVQSGLLTPRGRSARGMLVVDRARRRSPARYLTASRAGRSSSSASRPIALRGRLHRRALSARLPRPRRRLRDGLLRLRRRLRHRLRADRARSRRSPGSPRVPVGAIATAVLVVNNVRDRETDVEGRQAHARGALRPPRRRRRVRRRSSRSRTPRPSRGRVGSRRSPWALLPLATLPLALRLARTLATDGGAAAQRVPRRDGEALAPHGVLFAAGLVAWGLRRARRAPSRPRQSRHGAQRPSVRRGALVDELRPRGRGRGRAAPAVLARGRRRLRAPARRRARAHRPRRRARVRPPLPSRPRSAPSAAPSTRPRRTLRAGDGAPRPRRPAPRPLGRRLPRGPRARLRSRPRERAARRRAARTRSPIARRALAADGFAALKIKLRAARRRRASRASSRRSARCASGSRCPSSCASIPTPPGPSTRRAAASTRSPRSRPRFVEQPVAAAELHRLGACAVPWAADESLAHRPDVAERLLDAPAGAPPSSSKPRASWAASVRARDLAVRAAGARPRRRGHPLLRRSAAPWPPPRELALSLPRPPLACGLAPHDDLPRLRRPHGGLDSPSSPAGTSSSTRAGRASASAPRGCVKAMDDLRAGPGAHRVTACPSAPCRPLPCERGTIRAIAAQRGVQRGYQPYPHPAA